jgi:hypothetical protein
MERKAPIKGQTIVLHNNTFRNQTGGLPPYEVTVESVGPKYFTVSGLGKNVKFHKEDWSEKSDYASTFTLYESMQEYEDYKERLKLNSFFREFINGPHFRKVELYHLRAAKSHLITALAF